MELQLIKEAQRRKLLSEVVEVISFCVFLVTIFFVVYHDDIQLRFLGHNVEFPTIYNVRFLGLKVLDWLSATIFIFLSLSLFTRKEIEVSFFHKEILVIFTIYGVAGIIGFFYGMIYDYPFERWYQDFQQTLYMTGYFFLTFYLLNSWKRWMLFLTVFLGMLALKNIVILSRLFLGIGNIIGEFGMRTTQSADAAIFPILFLVGLAIVLHRQTTWLLRVPLITVMIIYLFNLLIGFGRTIWVVLPVISFILFLQLDSFYKRRLIFAILMFSLLSVGMVLFFFPKYFTLFIWKFSTIFDWSIRGDRSNATRLIEFMNITYRLFDQMAIFHGMGLGAWWDDKVYSLLPDAASGFMGKSRFYVAHVWIVQQLLKIGLIGVIIYWWTMFRMFRKTMQISKLIARKDFKRMLLIALNASFAGLMFASTDFPKVFLIVGVILGVIARLCWLILKENAEHPANINLIAQTAFEHNVS